MNVGNLRSDTIYIAKLSKQNTVTDFNWLTSERDCAEQIKLSTLFITLLFCIVDSACLEVQYFSCYLFFVVCLSLCLFFTLLLRCLLKKKQIPKPSNLPICLRHTGPHMSSPLSWITKPPFAMHFAIGTNQSFVLHTRKNRKKVREISKNKNLFIRSYELT